MKKPKSLLVCALIVGVLSASAGMLKWRSNHSAENQFRDKISPLINKDFALTQEVAELPFSRNATRGDIMATIKKDKEELAELNIQIDALTSAAPQGFREELAVYSRWRGERLNFVRSLDSWSDALFERQVAVEKAQRLMDFAKTNVSNGNQNFDTADNALKAVDGQIASTGVAEKRLFLANGQMQETATEWLKLENRGEMKSIRSDFAPNAPDVKPLIVKHLEHANNNATKYRDGDFS